MTEAEQYLIINGLREFMTGWCQDREKTDEYGEPKFRCGGCMFSDVTFCLVKQFVSKRFGKDAAYEVSCMSR